jgi:hypothetical protein
MVPIQAATHWGLCIGLAAVPRGAAPRYNREPARLALGNDAAFLDNPELFA